MDKRYENGRIYTVRCRYDDTLIYVGSTIEIYLSRRMAKHRCNPLACLNECVNGDWDNWYIELYENYPCKSKQELEKREGEIIRLIGTLNRRIEGRTQKEYVEVNRDKILNYQKEYYKDNRDTLLNYQKEYVEVNRDTILEKQRDRNREEKTCEKCGFIGLKHHLKRHQQSPKCLNYNVVNN